MKYEILDKTSQFSGKFIDVYKTIFKNEKNKIMTWQSVSRKNNNKVVDIIAFKDDNIVLIKQFRAPLEKYCISFPSGLIDDDETPEEAAMRELKEETGYSGEILFTGNDTSSSAGLTNEIIIPVVIKINQEGAQDLQDNENIDVIIIPIKYLKENINKLIDDQTIICSRVMNFILGNLFI